MQLTNVAGEAFCYWRSGLCLQALQKLFRCHGDGEAALIHSWCTTQMNHITCVAAEKGLVEIDYVRDGRRGFLTRAQQLDVDEVCGTEVYKAHTPEDGSFGKDICNFDRRHVATTALAVFKEQYLISASGEH